MREDEDLFFGFTNFDNVGSAFLTIFQCTTQDGWSDIMAIYEDAFAPWFVSLYFVLVVVVCADFILNLTIALMLLKYDEAQQDNSKTASHDSDERDMFSKELHDLGEKIFPEKYHNIVDFIVDTDGIAIDKGAYKELKAASGFWQSLFEGEKYLLDRTQEYY